MGAYCRVMPRGGPPSKPLADREWLAERIAEGLTTVEIAAAAGCTDRTVRNAIVAHGLPRPARTQDGGPIDVAVAAYVEGMALETAARVHGVGKHRLKRVLLERDVVLRGRTPSLRGSRYPQLNDRAWLAEQMARGVPLKAVAREVGCDRQTVRKALRRHGLDPDDVLTADRVWARQRAGGRATAERRWA